MALQQHEDGVILFLDANWNPTAEPDAVMARIVRPGGLSETVMLETALLFHTPGGREHDQKTHGNEESQGDASAEGVRRSLARLHSSSKHEQEEALAAVQSLAIERYTGSAYVTLNRALREGTLTDNDEEMLDLVEELEVISESVGQQAIDKLIAGNGGKLDLYRAVVINQENDDEWVEALSPGTVYQERGFFSAAYSENTALKFGGWTAKNLFADPQHIALFKTTVKKGDDVRGFIGNIMEDEVVLSANALFKVKSFGKVEKRADFSYPVQVIELEFGGYED